jgi:hypothetical protein
MSDNDNVVGLSISSGISRKTQVAADKFYENLWAAIEQAGEDEIPYNIAVGIMEIVKFRFICAQETAE